MTTQSKLDSGFTIVELLIVIVVIAILAAIGLLAYNGITQRSIVAHYGSSVSTYDKALRLNKVRTGKFAPSSVWTSCLGTAADYPATAEFPAGACAVDETTGAVYNALEPDLVNEVMQLTTLPNLPKPLIPLTAWGTRWRGVWVNFGSTYYEIEMALPRSMSCPQNMNQYDSLEENVHWCELETY